MNPELNQQPANPDYSFITNQPQTNVPENHSSNKKFIILIVLAIIAVAFFVVLLVTTSVDKKVRTTTNAAETIGARYFTLLSEQSFDQTIALYSNTDNFDKELYTLATSNFVKNTDVANCEVIPGKSIITETGSQALFLCPLKQAQDDVNSITLQVSAETTGETTKIKSIDYVTAEDNS